MSDMLLLFSLGSERARVAGDFPLATRYVVKIPKNYVLRKDGSCKLGFSRIYANLFHRGFYKRIKEKTGSVRSRIIQKSVIVAKKRI